MNCRSQVVIDSDCRNCPNGKRPKRVKKISRILLALVAATAITSASTVPQTHGQVFASGFELDAPRTITDPHEGLVGWAAETDLSVGSFTIIDDASQALDGHQFVRINCPRLARGFFFASVLAYSIPHAYRVTFWIRFVQVMPVSDYDSYMILFKLLDMVSYQSAFELKFGVSKGQYRLFGKYYNGGVMSNWSSTIGEDLHSAWQQVEVAWNLASTGGWYIVKINDSESFSAYNLNNAPNFPVASFEVGVQNPMSYRDYVIDLDKVTVSKVEPSGTFKGNAIVSGTVRNEDGSAIPSAVVSFGNCSTVTDASGAYQAIVPFGTYNLTAKAYGYKDYTETVTVSDTLAKSLSLVVDPAVEPGAPPDPLRPAKYLSVFAIFGFGLLSLLLFIMAKKRKTGSLF